MKRRVIIAFDVDPTEYMGAEDSPIGALELVTDMLRGLADLPTRGWITCDDEKRELDL